MPSLVRSVAPVAFPVDVATVKAGLRIDNSDEDSLLANLIAAATDLVEAKLGRALLAQTWIMMLDRFPGTSWTGRFPGSGYGQRIGLPWPVARTVTVEYQATAGVWTTLDASLVTLIPGPPSFVTPAYQTQWPTPVAHADVVRVTFSAYSWASASAIPAGVKQWIIAKVGELFEQREASSPVPLYSYKFLDGLLSPWLVPDYAGVRSGDAGG